MVRITNLEKVIKVRRANLEEVIKADYSEDGELTCNDLLTVAEAVEDLREILLFTYEEAGSKPIVETDYLAGLGYLQLAYSSFKRAHYNQIGDK